MHIITDEQVEKLLSQNSLTAYEHEQVGRWHTGQIDYLDHGRERGLISDAEWYAAEAEASTKLKRAAAMANRAGLDTQREVYHDCAAKAARQGNRLLAERFRQMAEEAK